MDILSRVLRVLRWLWGSTAPDTEKPRRTGAYVLTRKEVVDLVATDPPTMVTVTAYLNGFPISGSSRNVLSSALLQAVEHALGFTEADVVHFYWEGGIVVVEVPVVRATESGGVVFDRTDPRARECAERLTAARSAG